jgi:hypothetical protein
MTNLPMIHREDDYIIRAANKSAGFGRIMTYVKGEYFIEKVVVPLGSKYKVYTREWVHVWINFDERPVQQKIYRIAQGQQPPERDTLGSLDKSLWSQGFNGQPKDPWVLQYIIPFEAADGEVIAFRTSSSGGMRAVADLCKVCAFRSKRGEPSIPTIALATTTFPTTKFGKVAKPQFDIVGWDQDSGARYEINEESLGEGGEENPSPIDDIPF